MPDPYEVAESWYKAVPNTRYKPAYVGKVMVMTRDFVFKNEITRDTLIISEIYDLVETRGIDKPSPNAVKNWIKIYANRALST